MSARRLALVLRAALWLAVLGLLAVASTRHALQFDWTANQRNTLTAASLALLRTLDGPVEATAYVFPDADIEREIRARFAPYRRAKADFSLRIVDPATAPQSVREHGIADSGEVLLEYQGRRQGLTLLTEASISAALQRLAYAEQSTVRVIAGHGERALRSDAPSALGRWAGILEDKGMRLETLTLALAPEIPPDTSLLVLASPQQDLLEGELKRLQAWIAAGGHLLWLSDPDSAPLPGLLETLGLERLPGTVVYQDYELLGLSHPALALVAKYADHPVTRDISEMTLFPIAGGLAVRRDSSWEATALVQSIERSWLESGPLDGPISRDAQDIRGPQPIALALERPVAGETRRQRVAVIADGDFLSNAVIDQLGNRRFAVNLTQWLIERDAQIDIDVPAAPDTTLQLAPWQTRLFGLVYLILLPLGLAATGFGRWWWRSRRR